MADAVPPGRPSTSATVPTPPLAPPGDPRPAARLGWVRRQRATVGSLFGGCAIQASLVVSGVLAARLLGPQDRGFLALMLLIPVILWQLGALGMPVAATYFIARRRESAGAIARRLTRPAMLQALCLVPVHAGVLWLAFAHDPHRVQLAAATTLASIPAALAQQYGLAVLQGQQRFLAFNVLRATPVALYAAFLVALFVAGTDRLLEVALAWVTGSLLAGTASLVVAARGLPAVAPEGEDVPSRTAMAGFGLRSLLGYASPVESFRLDQAVVALFLTPVALGLYVVGLAFTNLPRFLAQSVGAVAYPRVAAEADSNAARSAMWRFSLAGTALAAVVVVAVELAAGWLVPFFFGHAFVRAVPLARLLMISALLYSARRVLTEAARGRGFIGLGSLGEAVSLVLLLPLLAVLVPAFGAEGVAGALAGSAGVSLLVLCVGILRSDRTRGRPAPLDPAEVFPVAP